MAGGEKYGLGRFISREYRSAKWLMSGTRSSRRSRSGGSSMTMIFSR